ncbi:hypothetical protein [Solicola sp. PLA-1-18]|uniref:hypothetical protein n=1 Tax=Solicola sp. PLA-1-18 TaxID=3380532 RepID=UPI003B805938
MVALPVAALGAEWWYVPLLVLLGTWLLAAAVLSEILLLRHHVHEHGIVSQSVWPYPRRVVPFYSVDPASLRMAGYHRADGTWKDSRNPRFREVPGVPTLRMVGLRPDRATALARGTATWNSAPYVERILGTTRHGQQEVEPVEWVLAWRDGGDDVGWLRGLVVESKRVGHM